MMVRTRIVDAATAEVVAGDPVYAAAEWDSVHLPERYDRWLRRSETGSVKPLIVIAVAAAIGKEDDPVGGLVLEHSTVEVAVAPNAVAATVIAPEAAAASAVARAWLGLPWSVSIDTVPPHPSTVSEPLQLSIPALAYSCCSHYWVHQTMLHIGHLLKHLLQLRSKILRCLS